MFLELNEDLKKKIIEATNIDYEFKGNYLPCDSIISLIEDLLCEIDILKEKQEKREQDIENNFVRITPEKMYGINDNDFMEIL